MVTVSVSKFESARHMRTDTRISETASLCAQDYMPPSKSATKSVSKSRDSKTRNEHRTGTRAKALNGSQRRCNVAATGGGASKRGGAVSDAWVRPRHAERSHRESVMTVQGLCNRCGTGSFATLAPKFAEVARARSDPDAVVRELMANIGASSHAASTLVRIMDHLRCDPELCIDSGLSTYISDFVASEPHLVKSAPDPVSDYAGFCDYVTEQEFKLKVTGSLISLGFLGRFVPLVDAALDVVNDPEATYDKGTAVKFVLLCLTRGSTEEYRNLPGWKSGVLGRVANINGAISSCNMDKRTEFAMLDLCRDANISRPRKAVR